MEDTFVVIMPDLLPLYRDGRVCNYWNYQKAKAKQIKYRGLRVQRYSPMLHGENVRWPIGAASARPSTREWRKNVVPLRSLQAVTC